MDRFYYVAPVESINLILKNGILPPIEVKRLIQEGKLPEEVLGVSYKGYDSSNFPEYVSLVRDERATKMVAEAICYSRTKSFNNPNFRAIAYEISGDIESMPEFVDQHKTKEMFRDCYPSEVLFRGRIDPRFIGEHPFAVRAWNY